MARLRKALGDPLLVRARDGMEPTPRAEAIAGVVQQLLELRRDLAEGGQTFSPDRLKREFIIAGSDIAHLVVLTALHSAARFEAPHTSYRALTLSGDEMVSALETGHRSEEHRSDIQSIMRSSYAVFCLKKNKT